jgi:hypothetical protein
MDFTIALVHFFALVFISAWALRRSNLSRVDKTLLIFLFFWADLVVVGNAMSLISALGKKALFIELTTVAAVITVPFLRKIEDLSPAQIPSPTSRFGKTLLRFFGVTFAAALLCNVAIALFVIPVNPDSLAYRLPRIFFYLSHGSLSHFADSVDGRLFYYPLNGPLLYSFPAYHHLGPGAFNLISCIAWILVGLAAYSICKGFTFSRVASVGTAWLVCFTPNVLAQATSTNDEILAAAPLLIGIRFTLLWLRTRQISHALVAGLAVGLSFGTKLHFLFYWPLALTLGVGLLLRRDLRIIKQASAAALMIALFSLPFAAYNYSSKGQILNKAQADALSNKPFSAPVAAQTTVLYAAQLFFNPILDLNLKNSIKRDATYKKWNQFCNEHFFRWVNFSAPYMGFFYRFQGIWWDYSYYFMEESIFLGFTPLLFVFGFVCLREVEKARRWPLLILLGSFWVYFFTYSATTKYIETTGIYFAYALMVASPALGVLWFPFRSASLRRMATVLLGLVIAGNSVLAVNLFKNNVRRNLRQVRRELQGRSEAARVDDPIRKEFQEPAGGIHLVYTHWELAAYSLIQVNPAARFTIEGGAITNRSDVLNVFSYPAMSNFGSIPVQAYPPGTNGLVYLGIYDSSYGPEYTFAKGNHVEVRNHADSGYIVLQATIQQSTNAFSVEIAPRAEGVVDPDKWRFRYTLSSTTEILGRRDWLPSSGAVLKSEKIPTTLEVEVELKLDGQAKISTVRYPLSGAQPLLSRRL